MKDQAISDQEVFHNTFYYFVKALKVMAMDASSQIQEIETPNLAWEIQHDVLELGMGVKNAASTFMSEDEKEAVGRLLTASTNLSHQALQLGEDAVRHQDWELLRTEAGRLITALQPAIQRNLQFFQTSMVTGSKLLPH